MRQHTTDNTKLPITSSSVKGAGRTIRLRSANAARGLCPTCDDPLTGPACLKCNKVRIEPEKRRLRAVTPAVMQARCLHPRVACLDCEEILENVQSSFFPRGPNGGFIVQHRLWDGRLHPIEWHFGWEHPDTGEYFSAMPAKSVLDVLDMCAVVGDVRPSWVFARSARWKSRLATYGIRVRTIDWMVEIYYDKANLEQLEADAFDDSTFSRVKPETRAERRLNIRMAHIASGCFDASCRALHRPTRPRDRKH